MNETGSSSYASSSGRYSCILCTLLICSYKESREVTLLNGRKKITQIASGLNLQNLISNACNVFNLAVAKNFTQGRKATHVCAACLYVACRMNKVPTMLIDFADLLQTDVYRYNFLQFTSRWSLGSVYMKMNNILG